MADSRTINSLRNSVMAIASQIISILLGFIGRTFFIRLLSIEYLGVNGLFSNILSLLSLAELGVGTAITYMMYKPIAENDICKVAAYNNLFRKIYNVIGLFILIVGIAVTPFIYSLIKEPPKFSENLYIIYNLFVVNTAISYFFTYKRSLLIAYQKEHINSQNIVEFAILQNTMLIVLLYLFRNYYVYLGAQILITFASNVAISYKVNRVLPEIVNQKTASVSRSEIKTIVKNTAAMVCHKIGSVIVSGTGNIFISYFVGIATVGIYSNYVMINNYANQIIGRGVNSLTASFGNLVATSGKEYLYIVFKRIYFMNFVLAFCITLLLYALIDPFITVWIGNDYLLDTRSILIIVVNSLFFSQIRIPSQMVINTCGLFWQIKWKSIVEALVNLCCSFFFAAYLDWGIMGILLAGLVSNILTNMWWEPFVAFRHGLKMPVNGYATEFMKNVSLLLCNIFIVTQIFSFTDTLFTDIIAQMVLRFLITVLLITGTIVVFYYRTPEFIFAISTIRKFMRKH